MASLSKLSKWRKQLVSVDEYLCVALDEKGLDSNPMPLAVEMDQVKIRCGDLIVAVRQTQRREA